MTQYGDRCGDCGRFPGNGKVCSRMRGGIYTRSVVYALDNKCEEFHSLDAKGEM